MLDAVATPFAPSSQHELARERLASSPALASMPALTPPPPSPAPPTELDDAMARLADGERAAFTPVFRGLWPTVERFCRRLLTNEADAADAAQEAMKKIFERASDYEPGRPALPWALALAGYECRTLRKKRERRREEAWPAGDPSGDHETEQLVIERDLTEAALEALGELSELDREALLATFWDEATDVAGPTLRKRRSRALARLRQSFRRLYGTD